MRCRPGIFADSESSAIPDQRCTAIALHRIRETNLCRPDWFAARTWISLGGQPMPPAGYIAMTLGIVFSVVIGCGLMALVFYSSRHGYDEPPQVDRE
jgi:hypothetical protein